MHDEADADGGERQGAGARWQPKLSHKAPSSPSREPPKRSCIAVRRMSNMASQAASDSGAAELLALFTSFYTSQYCGISTSAAPRLSILDVRYLQVAWWVTTTRCTAFHVTIVGVIAPRLYHRAFLAHGESAMSMKSYRSVGVRVLGADPS
ncbi:hypothetical protein BV20DRAFT_777571 [Pilatotrama ljubarskyi]|nr:hypothetical protein BV20DRAFT_777571 [Pilatotrama ljubarskyi]